MSETPEPATLLFVDDEPGILSALRRLFRPHGYRILVAESGAAGLALLSWLPQADFAQVMEHNAPLLSKHAGLNVERLTQAVQHAQQLGYSKIADFAVPGVSGVGVPVLDLAGQPVVALSVATVTPRMTVEHEEHVVKILRNEASKMRAVLRKSMVA